jgi:murein tripeptide amidase MpaA
MTYYFPTRCLTGKTSPEVLTEPFSLQLPANAADWTEKAALRKDQNPEQFLRELIITRVEEEVMPLTLAFSGSTNSSRKCR